jgi:hypothetical protein
VGVERLHSRDGAQVQENIKNIRWQNDPSGLPSRKYFMYCKLLV